MSFHNRINERGAFRQHLNRAQNLVPRVPQKDKEDEEDEKQPTIAAATVAKTIAKITPATTIAKVTATPSVVRSTPVSVATTAATTARQFPIPKGDDPFGAVTTSTSSSAVPPPSSSPASIPPSASTASASSASAASQTAARGLVSSSVPVASPTPNVGLGDAAASALPASASSTPSADDGSSKGGLSGGAAGAIVAILILAVVGVGAFFARKYYKRRREIKRNTWGAGLVPALENKRSTLYGGDNAGFGSEPMPPMASIPPSPAAIKVPSAMYNSPSSASPPPFVPPTIQAPNGMAAPAPPQPIGEIAVVVRTFVPNLPDELHITTGEHIRVLNAFDDGWALCANIRNEQGVVPLECLQRDGKRGQLEMQLQPESAYGYDSNRASKRLSSLVPNATGTY